MKAVDSRIAKRKKYERLLDITAGVIRAWDPYRLLAEGAPADEFDREIAALVAQIPRMESAADAVQVISRIFSSSFEPSLFTPQFCEDVGELLFAALKAQGLK